MQGVFQEVFMDLWEGAGAVVTRTLPACAGKVRVTTGPGPFPLMAQIEPHVAKKIRNL